MANYTRNMRQVATFWARTGQNEFNEPTFAAPVTLRCRWQNIAQLYTDPTGRERTSQAVVYPVQPLALQGYLFEGTSAAADPRTVAGAYEIQQTGTSPNLANSLVLNKVWL